MLDITNETDYHIDSALIESIATTLTSKPIEVVFVHNDRMQYINKKFLYKDYPTDVLSFPLEDFGVESMPLGSIIINLDKALEVSQQLSHHIDSEVALLFIHGCLHLMGYDHEHDNNEHRAKEEELVRLFNLPASLIARNSR